MQPQVPQQPMQPQAPQQPMQPQVPQQQVQPQGIQQQAVPQAPQPFVQQSDYQQQAQSQVPQQQMQPNNGQQSNKGLFSNPKLKKIVIIVAAVLLGAIVIGTTIGVGSCVISGLPQSGNETYQKELSPDITSSTKYGDKVIKLLNKKYPETTNNIRIVKKEREDVYTYSSFESVSATYELEDEFGTTFRASYYYDHNFPTSYRAESTKESYSENYYAVSFAKAASKDVTKKLREEFGQEINFVLSGGYYSTSSLGDDNKDITKEEFFSGATGFNFAIFTGLKNIDMEKAGKIIQSTLNIKDDTTRGYILFAGKMNYKEMDCACGVDQDTNIGYESDNAEITIMGTIGVKRNGNVEVNKYEY